MNKTFRRAMPRILRLIAALSLALPATAYARPAASWIDQATGHRIVRISRTPEPLFLSPRLQS